MLADEKKRRQGLLEDRIYELSEKSLDEEGLRTISLKFVDIYRGGFRHSYSSFFPIIINISKKGDKYNNDYLADNLVRLSEFVEDDFVSGRKEFESIYEPLHKLSDNLNTEIGRWGHYSKYEQKIEDVKSQIDGLNTNVSVAQDNLDKASKKAATIQTELIAVLSVFAAIVVTFSGSFTFLGGVMTSIYEAKYCETVVLVAIVCGMVLFNTIFLLLYMVGKITERNIYARCKTEDCSCIKKCNNINRIRKRLPYVFYFNIACIVGIIVDCVVWLVTVQMGICL